MARRKTIWMFSGQGSQYRNMGRELYEEDPVFRECMDRCDWIVRRWIQVSLIDAIYDGNPSEAFDDTRLTHPALCAVQYSMARSLQARGHEPDRLLGYSLGEITAHIVAGVLSLEIGLELLHRHASLMESATPEGGMVAILQNPDELQPILQGIPDLWIAARNFQNHCVASGTPRALDQLQRRLESSQMTMLRLPVRRAFHSPLMDPAEHGFRIHLQSISPETPTIDIISATTGASSEGLDALWNATREPVNFMRTIRHLEDDHDDGLIYLDLGPSGTLETFVKYIETKPESATFSTITPWGGARKKIQAYESAL